MVIVAVSALLAAAQSTALVCPKMHVVGPPAILNPGDDAVYTLQIDNPALYTYSWTVIGGRITRGQGTASITIRYEPKKNDWALSATVEVHGLPEGCPGTITELYQVGDIVTVAVLLADFPVLQGRIDLNALNAFARELKRNSYDQGYIGISYKEGKTSKEIVAFEKKLVGYLTRRLGLARARLTFVRLPNEPRDRIRLYRVPPGAENPAID